MVTGKGESTWGSPIDGIGVGGGKGLRDNQADIPCCAGPQKQHFLELIERVELQKVHIRTLWLEPGDYPKLLGACDLGICLHTSTSGLDLPMKVRCERAAAGRRFTYHCTGCRYVRRGTPRVRRGLRLPHGAGPA